tara:strand:+ start:225 stop:428 length:204 start_codon:yes stop_codon:yes gene_type:complete
MSNMTIDLKTLIPILSLVAVLGGFYYTTQHRLDHTESRINDIEATLEEMEVEIEKAKKLPKQQKNKR